MNGEKFDLTYLSIDSVQEGVGSSQISPLILGLAKKGKKICLITFEKKKPSPQLVKLFSSAGIFWLPKEFGKPGTIGGISRLNSLRRSIPESSILHGRSDIATSAAILGQTGAPILWDVRSLWSDQRLIIGTPGWSRFTAYGARTLENLSARESSAMTTLTAAVVPILQQRHRRIPSIREVIPTSVQTQMFLPSPMPQGKLTCLLSGTFNHYYDMKRTRQILDEIRKKIDLRVIWARAEESPTDMLGVGEDIIMSASHSEMPKLVRESHFGISICNQDHLGSLAAAVPTKIGEFLASGRPVIVSKGIGDLDELLSSTKTGLIVDQLDSLTTIVDQVQALIDDECTPERCRELAMLHFDMEKSVDKYVSVYEKMHS